MQACKLLVAYPGARTTSPSQRWSSTLRTRLAMAPPSMTEQMTITLVATSTAVRFAVCCRTSRTRASNTTASATSTTPPSAWSGSSGVWGDRTPQTVLTFLCAWQAGSNLHDLPLTPSLYPQDPFKDPSAATVETFRESLEGLDADDDWLNEVFMDSTAELRKSVFSAVGKSVSASVSASMAALDPDIAAPKVRGYLQHPMRG